MVTIHKYPLEHTNEQEVLLPKGAKILTVQYQRRALCLWAQVRKEEVAITPRTVYIVGTGHYVPADGVYLTTVQEGIFVWHVYLKK